MQKRTGQGQSEPVAVLQSIRDPGSFSPVALPALGHGSSSELKKATGAPAISSTAYAAGGRKGPNQSAFSLKTFPGSNVGHFHLPSLVSCRDGK